jgi:hypothetical protein
MKRNRVRVCSQNENGNAMRYRNKALKKHDLLVAYFSDIEKNRFGAFTGQKWIKTCYIKNMRTPPDPQKMNSELNKKDSKFKQ